MIVGVWVGVGVGVELGVDVRVDVGVVVGVSDGVAVGVGVPLGVLEIPVLRASVSPVTCLPLKFIVVLSIRFLIFSVKKDLILQSSLNSSLPCIHSPL